MTLEEYFRGYVEMSIEDKIITCEALVPPDFSQGCMDAVFQGLTRQDIVFQDLTGKDIVPQKKKYLGALEGYIEKHSNITIPRGS
jgi:hypothetical protein